MAEKKILVEVFGGVSPTGGWGCSSGSDSGNSCGPAVEEETLELEKKLQETYGNKIAVKYVDTTLTGIQHYPLVAKTTQMGYGFPIVSVDGEPRFAGAIDLELIKQVIDEMNDQQSQ